MHCRSKNSSRGLPFYRKMITVRLRLLERGRAALCTYVTPTEAGMDLSPADNSFTIFEH